MVRFGLLGAGGGLAAFALLAISAWATWTPAVAAQNLILLVGLGGAGGPAALWLARRADRLIEAPEDLAEVGTSPSVSLPAGSE